MRLTLSKSVGQLNADPAIVSDVGLPSVFDAIESTAGGGIPNADYGARVPMAKSPTLTTLVSFNITDGADPTGSLIADAAGHLFGTTSSGGVDNDGTVFEIAETKHGYANAPTILASFTNDNGSNPVGSLIADAAGDLFGTTEFGLPKEAGTVFEITHSGFAPPTAPDKAPGAGITHSPAPSAAFVQAMASHGQGRSGSTSLAIHVSFNERPMGLSLPHLA